MARTSMTVAVSEALLITMARAESTEPEPGLRTPPDLRRWSLPSGERSPEATRDRSREIEEIAWLTAGDGDRVSAVDRLVLAHLHEADLLD